MYSAAGISSESSNNSPSPLKRAHSPLAQDHPFDPEAVGVSLPKKVSLHEDQVPDGDRSMESIDPMDPGDPNSMEMCQNGPFVTGDHPIEDNTMDWPREAKERKDLPVDPTLDSERGIGPAGDQ
ncbi:MAG: hypothetical protein GY696_34265 [Gammaproteobacteria bacterium]|nr:hypothetical protein [Gammaproteobacteria bacterium]